jgi:hypothetical protein
MPKKKRNEDIEPELFVAKGYWFRFKEYETVSYFNGHRQYVRPVKSSKIESYRPFDCFPRLLDDYLDLGKMLSEDQAPETTDDAEHRAILLKRETRNAKSIVEFARKYGLPGTLWQCDPKSPGSNPDSGEVFVENSLWSVSIPCAPTERRTGLIKTADFLKSFLIENISLSDKYKESFLRAYAEPVKNVVRDAVDFRRSALEWNRYRDKQYSPESPYIYIDRGGAESPVSHKWEDELRGTLAVDSVGMTPNFDGRNLRINYDFRSLISALRIMLLLNAAATAAGQLRLCVLPECGKAFIARYDRSRYCKPDHANAHRQKLWQNNQRKETRKGKSNGSKHSTTKEGR